MIMGQHLLIECHGQHSMLQSDDLKALMTRAALEGGATVLEHYFHKFGGHGGVTGVLVLSESHITVHTWPEVHYAAFDIFMCGHARPEDAAKVIAGLYPEDDVHIKSITRGFSLDDYSDSDNVIPNISRSRMGDMADV